MVLSDVLVLASSRWLQHDTALRDGPEAPGAWVIQPVSNSLRSAALLLARREKWPEMHTCTDSLTAAVYILHRRPIDGATSPVSRKEGSK